MSFQPKRHFQDPYLGWEKRVYVIRGRPLLVLVDPQGRIKDIRSGPNLIVQNGWEMIASHIGKSAGGQGAQYIGIGEDSGPIASTDNTISTEVASRILATWSSSVGCVTWNLSASFGSGVPGGGASVRQAGNLISATGGTMFAKASFAVVNKGSSDSLLTTWLFSMASA